ncbi:hypothetical protein [Sporosarcina cascadiensis]|uniref:hypothetical protein n=1 Tax=Sporosarcina cascadiensis TaxID=2660747 RepID=UPI00129BCF8F|nr:hypothetical protein [Sporosarcina cascadiensis]
MHSISLFFFAVKICADEIVKVRTLSYGTVARIMGKGYISVRFAVIYFIIQQQKDWLGDGRLTTKGE